MNGYTFLYTAEKRGFGDYIVERYDLEFDEDGNEIYKYDGTTIMDWREFKELQKGE